MTVSVNGKMRLNIKPITIFSLTTFKLKINLLMNGVLMNQEINLLHQKIYKINQLINGKEILLKTKV